MSQTFHHLPRIYFPPNMSKGVTLNLPEDTSHYLRNVLRKTIGDGVRLFNGTNGEWVGKIIAESKKAISIEIQQQIRPPESSGTEVHLIFSPLKKDRNDMVIEKAVELGVTHFHPILFARTIVRDMKTERIEAQIIEAAEQCERLSIPHLSPLMDFKKCLASWNKDIPICAAIERTDAIPIHHTATTTHNQVALLIGPEGGITTEEIEVMAGKPYITPVSLGPRILRAETAVFYGLSILSSRT